MTTSQARVARGIPAGGQFAADIHAEPSINIAAGGSLAENLSRSLPALPDLTPDQVSRLRSKKTPLRNAMASRGVTDMPSMQETDERIRSIQGRLNGRA
ncbi:hypothetical protein GCM10023063_15220 [Arthrobacter methylotrophus]|uniref:Uncharacterized protein n=1 Tax=Arthrobacter methylotrophus TaxID=121291 RepID=A0ABV5UN46_9MICC